MVASLLFRDWISIGLIQNHTSPFSLPVSDASFDIMAAKDDANQDGPFQVTECKMRELTEEESNKLFEDTKLVPEFKRNKFEKEAKKIGIFFTRETPQSSSKTDTGQRGNSWSFQNIRQRYNFEVNIINVWVGRFWLKYNHQWLVERKPQNAVFSG